MSHIEGVAEEDYCATHPSTFGHLTNVKGTYSARVDVPDEHRRKLLPRDYRRGLSVDVNVHRSPRKLSESLECCHVSEG